MEDSEDLDGYSDSTLADSDAEEIPLVFPYDPEPNNPRDDEEPVVEIDIEEEEEEEEESAEGEAAIAPVEVDIEDGESAAGEAATAPVEVDIEDGESAAGEAATAPEEVDVEEGESPAGEAPTAPLKADDKRKAEKEEKSGKRRHESDSEQEKDVESPAVCPICMEEWTNSGAHRLVCLRCGHLFGYSCIVRWLEVGCFSGQRRCPQCNKRATKRDIRTLYVHNLQAVDTTECEKLKEELAAIKQEKMRVEAELARVNLTNKMHAMELKQALAKIQKLESDMKSQSLKNSQQVSVTRMSLEHSLEISPSGGCRVLTYNSFLKQLYVSYNSSNNLFPGFCVRRIDMSDLRPVFGRSIFLHTKAIRDLAVRPQSHDVLLSVSLDKTAKLLDLSSNAVVNKFSLDSPVWSCCWDSGNLNNFFVGCQNGSVWQFDSRQSTTPLNQMSIPGDASPVTTLASLPYCAERVLPQGGLLVSKLTSCWAYALSSSGEYQGQQLPLEGPFTSLCHDTESDNILISRRPNANNPHICHILCQLEQEGAAITCNAVHTFLGGNAQMQLSRPCFMKTPNDKLVTAYVESNRSIHAWSIASGQTVATVKAHDPVKDLYAFSVENKPILCALSEKNLRIYGMV